MDIYAIIKSLTRDHEVEIDLEYVDNHDELIENAREEIREDYEYDGEVQVEEIYCYTSEYAKIDQWINRQLNNLSTDQAIRLAEYASKDEYNVVRALIIASEETMPVMECFHDERMKGVFTLHRSRRAAINTMIEHELGRGNWPDYVTADWIDAGYAESELTPDEYEVIELKGSGYWALLEG